MMFRRKGTPPMTFRKFIEGICSLGIVFFALAGGYLLHPALLIVVWCCFAFVNVADKHEEKKRREIREYLQNNPNG